jgi:hypothetical protein
MLQRGGGRRGTSVPYLEPTRESHQIETNTEPGTTASIHPHAWDKHIQDAKGHGGSQGNEKNIFHVQRALGDGVTSQSNHQTFNQIFDDTLQKFSEFEIEHFIISLNKKNLNKKVFIYIKTKKMSSFEFERKTVNGKPNPKYVDVLDEDKPIAGQKFVCVSFLSPEKILQRKDVFMFQEFLKQWDYSKSMEKFIAFLHFLSVKYHLDFNALTDDLKEFVSEEKQELQAFNVADDFKTFVDNKETELTEAFNREHGFVTNVRGLKVRGTFPTVEEAELRCKLIREDDPNHDVFVGPVGMWMPWDPEAYKTGRVEYMEEELNQLMNEKNKNEFHAKREFDARVKETKKKAVEENIKKAEKSGNSLTQTIDEQGNLINIANMNTQETSLRSSGEPVTQSAVEDVLFHGDNIVMDRKK